MPASGTVSSAGKHLNSSSVTTRPPCASGAWSSATSEVARIRLADELVDGQLLSRRFSYLSCQATSGIALTSSRRRDERVLAHGFEERVDARVVEFGAMAGSAGGDVGGVAVAQAGGVDQCGVDGESLGFVHRER